MRRRRVLSGLLLLILAGCYRRPLAFEDKPVSRIPRDAARFEITALNDTAVIFGKMEARWLRKGQRAYAVDPLNRDAIIARLTFVQLDSLQVEALITGQVRQVTPRDIVLVVRPRKPWWRDPKFLIGLTTGAALGVLAHPF